MVLSREELLSRIQDFMGDRVTEDNSISIIEDISDTYDNITRGNMVELENLKKAYDELNNKYDNLNTEWKQKYLKRFFNNENMNGELIDNNVDTPVTNITIDDLFERR